MPENDSLADSPFNFVNSKSGRVMIYRAGKLAITLGNIEAVRFIMKIQTASDREAQLLMARATGQYKIGNERPGDLGK